MKEVYACILAFLAYQVFVSTCCCTQIMIGMVIFYALYAILKSYGLIPKKSLKGEHAFITGAGSGIGKLMAIKLAEMGCKVTLADINLDSVKAVQKMIEDKKLVMIENDKTFAVKCDVSSVQDVRTAKKASVDALGPVSILINNAGIVSGKKILQNSEAMIQKTIDINTVSHHWTVREFLPSMLSNNHGHIVTIASVAGTVGVSGLADYCASKFGAVGFDESLRMELCHLKSKVRTTCICPYYIDTGMFNGVKTKMNYILPILNQHYASQRIIWAIQQDEPFVLIPWALNISLAIKGLLPTALFDATLQFFGANQSMDSFKGRQ